MKLKGLRWYIIGLICLSTIINFIDRSAINILWPYIHTEFGISDENSKSALALITTFFLIAYAIGQTASGKVMDWVGTRIGMTISILGWSVSIALHAIARSLFSFNIFRFFLGLFEAGNWPGATKSNTEWFPPHERAIAQGMFGASTAVGSIIAAPAIAILFLAFGWRITFVAIAGLGVLWVIPWLIFNKASPSKHPWITDEENKYITKQLPTTNISLTKVETEKVYTWKQLLQFKNTWGIILARLCIDPVWWLFITWLPTFLKDQLEFDIKQVGAFSWFPYLLAAIGGILGGIFSSRQIKAGKEPHFARQSAITIGSVLMLFSLLITAGYLHYFSAEYVREQPLVILGLIGITMFGFQFLISNLQTLPGDYFSEKNVGTIAGMAGTAAVIGTVCTTLVVPIITKTSYTSFFVLGAVLVPLSWLAVKFINSANKTST